MFELQVSDYKITSSAADGSILSITGACSYLSRTRKVVVFYKEKYLEKDFVQKKVLAVKGTLHDDGPSFSIHLLNAVITN